MLYDIITTNNDLKISYQPDHMTRIPEPIIHFHWGHDDRKLLNHLYEELD